MEVNRSIAEHEPERHTRIIQMSVQDAPTHYLPPRQDPRKRSQALDTRLNGRWLLLARGLWITLVVLTLTIFFVLFPGYVALEAGQVPQALPFAGTIIITIVSMLLC